jgi:hypothetical protein
MLTYPEPTIQYAVSRPDGDLHDVYRTPNDGWRGAAMHVLDLENEHNEAEVDRRKTALDLLEMNDEGVMWGWRVVRHAETETHPKAGDGVLAPRWANALSLSQGSDQAPGTFISTTLFLLDSMLGGDDQPIDVAVLTEVAVEGNRSSVSIGLVDKVDPDGHQLVFVDGHTVNLEEISALWVTYA